MALPVGLGKVSAKWNFARSKWRSQVQLGNEGMTAGVLPNITCKWYKIASRRGRRQSSRMGRLLFWLKVSRPGLWFQTLWLYTLPTSRLPVFHSPLFWLGLVYVTFPLNFLVYGWNDIVDFGNDRHNPRKDTFLFGARGSRGELARLPLALALAQAPFFIAFIALRGWATIFPATAGADDRRSN